MKHAVWLERATKATSTTAINLSTPKRDKMRYTIPLLFCAFCATAQAKPDNATCTSYADLMLKMHCRETKQNSAAYRGSTEGKAAIAQYKLDCQGFTDDAQTKKALQCARENDSQADYDRCMTQEASKKKEQPARGRGPKHQRVYKSTPECREAIDNITRIDLEEDHDYKGTLEEALQKERESKDYVKDVDECSRMYPPSLVACFKNAKTERDVDRCEDHFTMAESDRVSEQECEKVVEHAMLIELLEDYSQAQAQKMLPNLRNSSDYREAMNECKRELNVTIARCILEAQTENDIDDCTD